MPVPASNKLRGVIGNQLFKRSARDYQQFFDPARTEGPSGLSDPPRPFVLRSAHLDGAAIPPGGEFQFTMHLFDLRNAWQDALAEALRDTGDWQLIEVAADRPLTLDLSPAPEPIPRIKLRFETPMELKTRGGLATTPEFGILAARIRDRISTLSELYGDGPLPLDFAAFGERASAVKLTRCEIHRVNAERRSGSTGQTHSLGGFVGEAEYAGELAEFLPFLRAAQWTGVGRQTTWGKGAFSIGERVL